MQRSLHFGRDDREGGRDDREGSRDDKERGADKERQDQYNRKGENGRRINLIE